MRMILELDDDVFMAAKEMARLKGENLGRTISALARRGLMPERSPVVEMQDGIPVWIHGPGTVVVTTEMVRNLAEEE